MATATDKKVSISFIENNEDDEFWTEELTVQEGSETMHRLLDEHPTALVEILT